MGSSHRCGIGSHNRCKADIYARAIPPRAEFPLPPIAIIVAVIVFAMVLLQQLSLSAIAWAAFSPLLSFAQALEPSEYSSNADGLTVAAGSASATLGTVRVHGTSSTYRVIETLPASIDETPPVLANINDPRAIDAQAVCPG